MNPPREGCPAMRPNIVLVDLENVQPDTLERLMPEHFRVLIFVGPHQTKIGIDLARSMQRLGSRGDYIQVSANGKNALDFHIAYHLGRLAVQVPDAYFHIVSKDTGFDPLIAHLKAQKVYAARVPSVDQIAALKLGPAAPAPQRLDAVIERLRKPNTTRPRSRKTLGTTINALFQKQLTDDDIAKLIGNLVDKGVVEIDAADKVSYPETVAV